MLSFGTGNIGYLFSRSLDIVTNSQVDENVNPTPVLESLDNVAPDQAQPIDTEKLLRDLQAELLTVQDDPDKALELRRRIQLLQTQKESSSIPDEEAPQE